MRAVILTCDDMGNLTMDQKGYQVPCDNKNRLREIADFSDTAVVEYAYDPLVLQRYVGIVRP